ncbi:hypothetical protein FSP39_020728 [Pinctada imbricata]|uniref:Death domain-containing protein n=1 Tax=Pinctada imbricata TaxID=66713 RepID=A0AA89BV16_PINIB|nr:hypothetical protein FSP39_020728 [Pinctada imbricata]
MNSMNKSMISLEGSAVSSLELVLKYLHMTGEIVWYYENPKLKNIIFHRPDTLVEMLRAIFRHDFDKHVVYNETYGKLASLTSKKFEMMKEDFLTKGLMMLEMLHYCLLHFQLSVEARDMFIDLMLKFDLCYEVPKFAGAPSTFASSRVLKFPWFLSTEEPKSLGAEWPEKIPADIIEISFKLQFPTSTPPNFFEKTSARLQNHILQREDWKNGVLGYRNRTKILVCRESVDSGTDVNVAVRGSDLQEIWYLITSCHTDMMVLLQEWPFVHYEQYLVCTHCRFTGVEEPYLYPAEILQHVCPRKVYRLQCCPDYKDATIPACLVYPLDPDFQDDIGEHIKTVKEFLQSLEDTVDSGRAAPLTDFGLSYVAARLGVEWTLVTLSLGLTQPEIEQIQLDNPYQVVKQITMALIRWRDRQRISQSEDRLLRELFEALLEQGRRDLVEDIQMKYGIDEGLFILV